MIRVWIVLSVVGLLVWVYSVVDVALSDPRGTRSLPKWLWLLVVFLFPLVGAVLWFLFGRPRASGRQSETGGYRPSSGAPDDDPEFLRSLGKRDDQAADDRPAEPGDEPDQGPEPRA